MMEVITALGNVVYNAQECSVTEHIEFMQRVASEMIDAGNVNLPDNLILEYVLTSIEKSPGKMFELDIQYVRRLADPTIGEAIAFFQKTESKAHIYHKKTGPKRLSPRSINEIHSKSVH